MEIELRINGDEYDMKAIFAVLAGKYADVKAKTEVAEVQVPVEEKPKATPTQAEETAEPELDRDAIRKELDKFVGDGVIPDYNVRLGTPKLNDMLKEARKLADEMDKPTATATPEEAPAETPTETPAPAMSLEQFSAVLAEAFKKKIGELGGDQPGALKWMRSEFMGDREKVEIKPEEYAGIVAAVNVYLGKA